MRTMMDIPFTELALLVVLLGINFLCLHKVRKIHLATYGVREDAVAMRRETEALFSQVQALLALERKLDLPEALPPMRGWAGSPDFLMAVAEQVIECRPKCIMECSSGVSTLVVARCLQMNGVGHVYSLEHDREFADKTRVLLKRYGLSNWATVIDAPLKVGTVGTPWYDEDAIPNDLPPIEMLIVDGPPAVTAPLARFPALPALMPRLSENHIVILDDADRKDEVEMVNKWTNLFPKLQKRHIPCEKGLVFLYP